MHRISCLTLLTISVTFTLSSQLEWFKPMEFKPFTPMEFKPIEFKPFQPVQPMKFVDFKPVEPFKPMKPFKTIHNQPMFPIHAQPINQNLMNKPGFVWSGSQVSVDANGNRIVTMQSPDGNTIVRVDNSPMGHQTFSMLRSGNGLVSSQSQMSYRKRRK